MRPVVSTHVNQVAGLAHGIKGGIHHLLGRSHKCHHGAVGGLAWVHIEQVYSMILLDFVGDLLNDTHVSSLTEIGYTFHDSLVCFHV